MRQLQFDSVGTPGRAEDNSIPLDSIENGYNMIVDVRRMFNFEEERLVETDADGGHYLLQLWNALLSDQEAVDLVLESLKAGGAVHAVAPYMVKICRIMRLKGKLEKVLLLIEAKYTVCSPTQTGWGWLNKRHQHKEYNAVRIRTSSKLEEILTPDARAYFRQHSGEPSAEVSAPVGEAIKATVATPPQFVMGEGSSQSQAGSITRSRFKKNKQSEFKGQREKLKDGQSSWMA